MNKDQKVNNIQEGTNYFARAKPQEFITTILKVSVKNND